MLSPTRNAPSPERSGSRLVRVLLSVAAVSFASVSSAFGADDESDDIHPGVVQERDSGGGGKQRYVGGTTSKARSSGDPLALPTYEAGDFTVSGSAGISLPYFKSKTQAETFAYGVHSGAYMAWNLGPSSRLGILANIDLAYTSYKPVGMPAQKRWLMNVGAFAHWEADLGTNFLGLGLGWDGGLDSGGPAVTLELGGMDRLLYSKENNKRGVYGGGLSFTAVPYLLGDGGYALIFAFGARTRAQL